MSLRSCCLVTDIPPCDNYSGGIFTDHMLRSLGGQLRAAFILLNQSLRPRISPIAAGMQLLIVEKPNEYYESSQSSESVRDAEIQAQERISSEILPRLLEFAARFQLKSFWVLLEGQSMIRLAHDLIRATHLPVFVQVMDPPGNWFSVHRVDALSARELYSKYETVLRSASGCAAASWMMASVYTAQYGVPCVPVVPSLPEWHARPPGASTSPTNTFRIGIAGQLYAEVEWRRLLRVLASSDWKIGRAQVEVHAFTTSRMGISEHEGRHVVRREWLATTHGLIAALAEMDLLYMPYRFGEEHREEVRLCFPSKLTTYFASGRPVLLHGPADSSPIAFAKHHGAGFCSTAPDDLELLGTLEFSASAQEESRTIASNGRRAFDEHLTYKTLAFSIRRVLSFENSDHGK